MRGKAADGTREARHRLGGAFSSPIIRRGRSYGTTIADLVAGIGRQANELAPTRARGLDPDDEAPARRAPFDEGLRNREDPTATAGPRASAHARGRRCGAGARSRSVESVATYRVQLNADFDLDAAAELAPYLRDLVLSQLYC